MDTAVSVAWHALAAEEAATRLESAPGHGLDQTEARRRLERDGPNVITPPRGRPWWLRLLLQFHAPLIYILLAATAATILLGEYLDSAVIFAVVLVNAAIGFVEETRAVKAIDALARSMKLETTVLRDGHRRRVDAAELVCGDVVVLEAGDRIPADLRLLAVHDFHCDESALTGESRPVGKRRDPCAPDAVLADRTSMAYAGSLVTRGTAEGLVVATGDHTEVGRISEMIAGAEELATPLNRRIATFSRMLLLVILGVAGLTFAVGVLRGLAPVDMFMASVALAVAAIPEGLPAAVTIMLAVGVGRMARRKAIIRKLPAVEALGSTTVICSDKTGTLTQNQMTVQMVWVPGSEDAQRPEDVLYEIDGTGYEPQGTIRRRGIDVNVAPERAPAVLVELLRCGALCNDAQLLPPEATSGGRWAMQGDPTEAALLVAHRKLHSPAPPGGSLLVDERESPEDLHFRWPRRAVIPFDSEHQDMATLHARVDQAGETSRSAGGVIFWKGSVERALALATGALTDDDRTVPIDRAAVHAAAEDLASRGLRVLAFARCEVGAEALDQGLHREDFEHHGLVLLGLQGMLDPARPEAIEAVGVCQRAGIQVKMITGDHAATALSIARTIGLRGVEDDPRGDARGTPAPRSHREVLTGAEMARIPDDALPAEAESVSVFARMTPEQKLRLVKALQRRGHIVAMTGDGVNDAPALRQADIGVAMGLAGTEAAKDAADMVLADDNFASIKAAVEEGRTVFANLTKFLVWTLPTNGAQGTVIFASVILGWPLPILPIHALYVNMFTALLLGMPLIFEQKEPQVMDRPPRDPAKPLFTRGMIMRTGFVSLLLGGGVMAMFNHEIGVGTTEEVARTAGVTLLVLGQACYLFSARALLRPAWSIPAFSNPWLWAGIAAMLLVQVAFVHLAIANRLFSTQAISLGMWAWAIAAGCILLVLVEAEKAIRRRMGSAEDV